MLPPLVQKPGQFTADALGFGILAGTFQPYEYGIRIPIDNLVTLALNQQSGLAHDVVTTQGNGAG